MNNVVELNPEMVIEREDLPLYVVRLEEQISRLQTDVDYAKSAIAIELRKRDRKRGEPYFGNRDAIAKAEFRNETFCACHGVAPWRCESGKAGLPIVLYQIKSLYPQIVCERT